MNCSFRLALRSSRGLLLVLPLLTGCGSLSRFNDVSASPSVLPTITGNVHGGQQPVSGSTVKMYAANITTLKGASTSLLTSSVVTDANGTFSISNAFNCPAPGSLVYLIVTGGNPGLAAGTTNSGLSMMSLLGTCGSLTNSTHVTVNELTTVAAIEALLPFMTDGTHIGADLSLVSDALSTAFATANSIVSPDTGQFAPLALGQPTPPYALYNTLADILAACINSNGGYLTGSNYNTLTPCGNLYFHTGIPAVVSNTVDTLTSMLRMVQYPSSNIQILFGIIAGTGAPFQPTLTVAPLDWSYGYTAVVPIPYTANSNFYPRMVAIDGQQHVWVANYNTPTLNVFDQNLNLINSIVSDTYAIFFLQADADGNIWAGGSSLLSKYAPDGTVLIAGHNVFADGFYMTNTGMAIDKQSNVWFSAKVGSLNSKPCFAKYSKTGVPLFTAPGICPTTASVGPPLAIAVDTTGNAYLSTDTPRTLLKVGPTGTVDATFGANGINNGYRALAMQYDPTLDRIWMLDQPYLASAKASDASVQFGYLSGPNVINTNYVTLDGARNLWFAATINLGNSGTVTPSIGEYSSAGVYSQTTSSVDGSGIGGLKTKGMNYPQGVAIDAYGNLWIVNFGNHTLLKVPSITTGRTTQVF